MKALDLALAELAPMSLGEANQTAELQTRVDRKYLVDETTLCALLDALAPRLRVLEIDGRHSCGYLSTYFDTNELSLYRAAVQGRRRRFKVRSRTYGNGGPSFLEVKAKGRRGENVKSRIDYCPHDHDTITAGASGFIDDVTGDHHLAAALIPVLTTEYERSTVIDIVSQTRFTFDRRLRCSDREGNTAVLDAIVLETKSSKGPSATDQWLWQHHVRPTKISKFCSGLAAMHPELRSNKWHRLITRHWHVEQNSQNVASRLIAS